MWVGGKGFDLWLTFKRITKETKWDSPENPICFSPGPLGGTTSFPGAGKTLVTAISPLTNIIVDSNVGGHFGPFLKYSGFDALVVTGKSDQDIIIVIDSVKREIYLEYAPLEAIDSHVIAEELTEMYADNDYDKRNIAVVSSGQAADHTYMGVLNFSFWDWRREVARLKQAGRGGIGTVFRNKKIKAIVARNRQMAPEWSIEESKVSKQFKPEKIYEQKDKNDIDRIIEIIEKWDKNPEYVIEMMQDIQQAFKYISKTAIELITKLAGTPKAYLYHIATFYKSFSLIPKGKITVQVCTGTACHVKGSKKIIDNFERELAIKCGETTSDMNFSLESVACLGACSIAPVVKVGEEILGNVQVKDIKKIVQEAKKKIEL